MKAASDLPSNRARSKLFWIVAIGMAILVLWAARRAMVLSVFEKGDALVAATKQWLQDERPGGLGGAGGASADLPGHPLFDWSTLLERPENEASPQREGRPSGQRGGVGERKRPAGDSGDPDHQTMRAGMGEAIPGPPQRIPERTVLGWAEARVSPRGVIRPKDGSIPAGIELHGVQALGIDLRDGDRLVAVEGRPTTDRAGVVAAVLDARAKEQAFIVATVVRPGPAKPHSFTIAIEQPYLDEVEEP